MTAPIRPTRPYRPSNGTEGEGFTGHWCERCLLDRAVRVHQDYTNGCDILARSYMFDIDDPRYPVEWQQYDDEPWEAFCTAFVEDDHDDDWEPPTPPDPNQLVLLADPTEDAATIQNAEEVDPRLVKLLAKPKYEDDMLPAGPAPRHKEVGAALTLCVDRGDQ